MDESILLSYEEFYDFIFDGEQERNSHSSKWLPALLGADFAGYWHMHALRMRMFIGVFGRGGNHPSPLSGEHTVQDWVRFLGYLPFVS